MEVSALKSNVEMKIPFVQLGDIISLSKGKKHEPIGNGKNRYINIENLHNSANSLFTNEEGTFVVEDDLIIAWDGANAGKVGVGFVGVIGSTLARMRIKSPDVSPRYLFWYLESINESIKSQRTGATIPHVNGNSLKEIQIPLPPLSTQKRIAEILDAADALRCKDQELLKKYDELAQAIFIDMFGDPVKNEKGWECLVGKNYANRISVGVVIKPASFYVKNGVPALRSQNVRPNRITKDNLVYFSKETNETVLYKSRIYTGDVLIVRTGQPGTSAVVEEEMNGVNCIDMLIVSPKKEIISPYYLAFFLNSDAGKSYISSNQKGQIQQHFNVGDINNFKIPIPPIALQLKFEKILLNIKEQLSFDLSNGSYDLFNSLIQKAFKGELVS
jgi:type I restriction enzyme S subunit